MLKQDVINSINTLPDNVSIEDIMYRLYILDKHKKALRDIATGQIYSTEEVRKGIVKNQ